MSLVARSITRFVDSSGDVDTVIATPAPDVEWLAVPNFENNVRESAFSQTFTGFVTGGGAATAVFTLISVSGDSATALGLSFSGDALEGTVTVGAGSFRVRADYSGNSFFSDDFIFSGIATGTADTVAPTRPLIVAATVTSETGISLSILPPCDTKTPAESAAGLASIEVYRGENATNYALVTTISVNTGLSVQFTANQIGSMFTTPSATQTAADWSLTAEGVYGIDSPSPSGDEILFVAAPVSGNFDISAEIPSFSAPTSSKTMAMLMVRETLAADGKFIANGRLSNAASSPAPIYSEVKFRPTVGANIQFNNPQSDLSGSYWFRINRTGDLFSCYIWQEGDTNWTLNQSQTIVMSQGVFVGMACASGLADTEATVAINNVCLQNLSLVTFNDGLLATGTTYGYKCKGVDLA